LYYLSKNRAKIQFSTDNEQEKVRKVLNILIFYNFNTKKCGFRSEQLYLCRENIKKKN